MIKNILSKLWNGPHKVNNKLDGYWYVRLSDVSKVLEETLDEEHSGYNWNKGVDILGPNPHSLLDKGETNDEDR